MGTAENRKLYNHGPWKGLMMWPGLCSENHVEAAFNLDFDGNIIRSRKGRVPYMYGGGEVEGAPTGIFQYLTVNPYTVVDCTATLTDGKPSTTTTILAASANQVYYVGSPYPFSKLKLYVGTANTSGGSTTTVSYLQNGSAWNNVSGFTDGTRAGAGPATLYQTGVMSWTMPSDWTSGNPNDTTSATSTSWPKIPLYWVKISVSAVGGGASISELRTLVPSGGINGLYDFNGTLVVGLENAMYSSLVATTNGLMFVPVVVQANTSRGLYARWRFTSFLGAMFATNGQDDVVAWDGRMAAQPLQATNGLDSDSRAYLSKVPRGKFLATYRNRLFVAGATEAPRTVFFSEYNTASSIIPDATIAPYQGANIWPWDYNFDVSADGADEITGMVVALDRLIIFTKKAIYAFDDNALAIVDAGHGCVAPESIALQGNKIYFLSADGVREFPGAEGGLSSSLISYPVQPLIEKYLNRGNFRFAVGTVIPSKRHYRLWIPMNGVPRNRACLVYNYEQGWWSVWGGSPYWIDPVTYFQAMEVESACVLSAGTDEETVVTGDYDGKLWVEDIGFTDGGKPIPWMVKSKRFGWEDSSQKTWRNIRMEAEATGCPAKFAVMNEGDEWESSYGSYSRFPSTWASTALLTLSGQSTWVNNTAPAPAYVATSDHGQSVYGPVKTLAPWKISEGATCRNMQVVIWYDGFDATGTPAGGVVGIHSFECEYKPGGGR